MIDDSVKIWLIDFEFFRKDFVIKFDLKKSNECLYSRNEKGLKNQI